MAYVGCGCESAWASMAKEWWWWSGHVNGVLIRSNGEGGEGKGGETKAKDENNVGCGCVSAWLRSGGSRVGISIACSLGVTMKVALARVVRQR